MAIVTGLLRLSLHNHMMNPTRMGIPCAHLLQRHPLVLLTFIRPTIFDNKYLLFANPVLRRIKEKDLLRSQAENPTKWVDARHGNIFTVEDNPTTEELLANAACMGGHKTKDAIASADAASYTWSKLTATERSKILHKWYELLMAHKEELGQPRRLGEVVYGKGFLKFYAEEGKHVYGDIIPPNMGDRRLFVLKQDEIHKDYKIYILWDMENEQVPKGLHLPYGELVDNSLKYLNRIGIFGTVKEAITYAKFEKGDFKKIRHKCQRAGERILFSSVKETKQAADRKLISDMQNFLKNWKNTEILFIIISHDKHFKKPLEDVRKLGVRTLWAVDPWRPDDISEEMITEANLSQMIYAWDMLRNEINV